MKRSAQVALVLMGVTGTTATPPYLMPPRAIAVRSIYAVPEAKPSAALRRADAEGADQPVRGAR